MGKAEKTMKKILLFTFLILCIQNFLGQELRLIRGKVLDEDLIALPGVRIFINDTIRIAETDLDGNFELQVNPNTKKLNFKYLGCEITPVILKSNCTELEVIMLYSGGDCFSKPKEIERKRKKRFQTLPTIYKSAHKKGLFKSINPCGDIQFISWFSDDQKPSP